MSTLKVSAIQSPSTTDGGLAISSTGAVSGGLPTAGRQLLYNGAMQVAQRGTSATGITGADYYTADRWQMSNTSMGTWTQSVESDAPSGSGLSKSLKMLCTTADSSPAADDVVVFQQALEGQDLQRIAKGTASAQQVTLSFWVKSNVTGTYVVELHDTDNTRSVGATYTISASGTWERKTITYPADTTGVLDNDNAASLYARWWLGAGSNRTSGTLNTAWAARVAANIAPGQTNLAAATNNYWQITGVQLETGPVATEFEHRSFGDELARCQRYYQKIGGTVANERLGTVFLLSTTGGYAIINTKRTMRSTPTASYTGTLSVVQPGVGAGTVSSLSDSTMGPDAPEVGLTFSSVASFAQGELAWLTAANAASFVNLSAEL